MKMPKRGPWTVGEDTVLVEYIKRHGEGNWNMVERNCGLMRCGKSCRLRWFNHLRPNLKRGTFSPEEERIVVELHAQLGNRWARISMKLPGRSDNEIKNFWNTRAKRLERAGLPLYPEGLIARPNPIRHRNQNRTMKFSSLSETNFTNPSERSVPSLMPSSSNPRNSEFKLSPQLSMGPFTCSIPTNPSTPILPNSSFPHYSSYPKNANSDNFSLSSNSYYPPFSSIPSSFTIYYPSSRNPNPPLSMPNSFDSQHLFANNKEELSSIQSAPEPPTDACESSNRRDLTKLSILYDPQCRFAPLCRNDGLLEDICGAPKTLALGDILSGKDSDCGSSSPSTTTVCHPIEEMLPFDDDLSALLENFPMEVPRTKW